MKRTTRHYLRAITLGAVTMLAFALSFVAAEYWATHPSGSEVGLWWHVLVILPLVLLAVLAAPLGLVLAVWRRTHLIGIYTLVISIGTVAGTVLGGQLGGAIRNAAMADLAARSHPLIQAINDYSRDHESPPASLGDLVPRYLAQRPSTALAAYPEYRYERNPQQHFGNAWALWVETPSGGINFDRFIYLPDQNYPAVAYGGTLERIDDWAYVHE